MYICFGQPFESFTEAEAMADWVYELCGLIVAITYNPQLSPNNA